MNVGEAQMLRVAADLDAVARDANSVDPAGPILCGLAANRLYAASGVMTTNVPELVDEPAAVSAVVTEVAEALASRSLITTDPSIARALAFVLQAQRALAGTL